MHKKVQSRTMTTKSKPALVRDCEIFMDGKRTRGFVVNYLIIKSLLRKTRRKYASKSCVK